MRNFIIVGHRTATTPDFSLNDLPGSGGRMDLMTRAVNSGFCISHDIRRDVEIALVLLGPEAPPKTVRFVGSELKYLNPDERSTGALIRNALARHKKLTIKDELIASPGIYISNNSFQNVLEHYFQKSKLVCLHEDGGDISQSKLPEVINEDLTFILSDHLDFTENELEQIHKHSPLTISLGPLIIHTDHCISIIHNNLDRLYAIKNSEI